MMQEEFEISPTSSRKRPLLQETGWKWHRWALVVLLLVLFVATPASGPHYGGIRHSQATSLPESSVEDKKVERGSQSRPSSSTGNSKKYESLETGKPLSLGKDTTQARIGTAEIRIKEPKTKQQQDTLPKNNQLESEETVKPSIPKASEAPPSSPTAKKVSKVLAPKDDEKPQENKKIPSLIWLLSFPNSGTTYTLKVI